MDKFIYIATFIVFSIFPLSAQQRSYLPPWQEGFLDIHLMAVLSGESTYMVLPDGTTMLIDASGVGKNPIDAYIDNFEKGTLHEGMLDYVLLTHFHPNHMGGLLSVGNERKIGKIIDRGFPTYDFPAKEHVWSASEGFIDTYREYVNSKKITVEKFDVGSSGQIVLIRDSQKYEGIFKVVNLGANGESWTGNGTAAQINYKGDPSDIDEDALSCAVRIDYGKFRYYTGGDLTGGWWGMTPEEDPKERDFESPVAQVCGPVTAMKLDNHGWKNSSNAFFIQSLRPEVILIGSADKGCPQYFTLKRVMDKMIYPGEKAVYCTTDAAKEENPKPSHFVDRMTSIGHIVIRVYEGGEKYQVFAMQNDDATYPLIYRSEIKYIR